MSTFWRNLGFGGRLTVSMVGLILLSISFLTSLVFFEYKSSKTNEVLDTLQSTGQLNAQAFTDWLLVRQEEMRYLAALPRVQQQDLALATELMFQLAENSGYYDTIFVVGPDGVGMAGVAYVNGRASVMSETDVANFKVADRAWFRQAINGQDTFSEPVVSRATGNRVSTVAIPIRHNNQIIAVMRGAVQLSTIFERVSALMRDEHTEIYLLDSSAKAITPVRSITDSEQTLSTQAGEAIRNQKSGVGLYTNALSVPVIGSYNYIPMLGWGLILESRQAEALGEVQSMLWTLLLISVIVLLIAVAVCLLLVRNISRILGGEPEYTAAVVHQVAEGDLTAKIHTKAGDDHSLLTSVAVMQQKLRQMMGQVSDYSDQVAAAATQLSHINDQSRHGIEQQNTEISHSAVAMNQMTSSLEEVSRNTQQAAQAAIRAEHESSQGDQIVSNTIIELNSLSVEVTRAADIINLLKHDSDHIGTILQVIESIAEQTNLLALNAAIEAARAGESGRGFAVVADEVRSLASRTKDSTTEIKQMIDKLQTGTANAVKATASSVKAAYDTAERAGNAGKALKEIRDAVALISSTAHQIATATEQQTTVSRDINQNIHRISDVAYQTSENIVQSASASGDLSRLAERLQELVRRFRL